MISYGFKYSGHKDKLFIFDETKAQIKLEGQLIYIEKVYIVYYLNSDLKYWENFAYLKI